MKAAKHIVIQVPQNDFEEFRRSVRELADSLSLDDAESVDRFDGVTMHEVLVDLTELGKVVIPAIIGAWVATRRNTNVIVDGVEYRNVRNEDIAKIRNQISSTSDNEKTKGKRAKKDKTAKLKGNPKDLHTTGTLAPPQVQRKPGSTRKGQKG
jgi:hypothetical protein